MALTAAMKSGPCLCDASATCPRICPLNLGTSYFKDKVLLEIQRFYDFERILSCQLFLFITN